MRCTLWYLSVLSRITLKRKFLVLFQDVVLHSLCYLVSLTIWRYLVLNRQRWAIRREFERVGLTLLKDLLSARWDLLPTLQWVGSWLYCQGGRRFHSRELNRQPLRSDLGTSSLSYGNLGSSWTGNVITFC